MTLVVAHLLPALSRSNWWQLFRQPQLPEAGVLVEVAAAVDGAADSVGEPPFGHCDGPA